MRINPYSARSTQFYVVSDDGTTAMNLHSICNAVKAGMDLNRVAIFTDEAEAKAEQQARDVRRKFSNSLDGLSAEEVMEVWKTVAATIEGVRSRRK